MKSDSELVVEGDEVTLICEAYTKPIVMNWIPATGNESQIQIEEKIHNKQYPAGNSNI